VLLKCVPVTVCVWQYRSKPLRCTTRYPRFTSFGSTVFASSEEFASIGAAATAVELAPCVRALGVPDELAGLAGAADRPAAT
jgi:hypothetical protein